MIVYLDNSATTRPYDAVIDRMTQIMREEYGNPSALHSMGAQAEKRIREARRQLAAALHADPAEVLFTSGGTESDNMALISGARARRRRGNRILTTLIEHPAVLETCRRLESDGFQVTYLRPQKNGIVDPQELAAALDEKTILISVMHVNNETGAIQPLAEIGRIKKAFEEKQGRRILFHTDAVQSFGKLPLDLSAAALAPLDLASFSAHKNHGPKGAGALFIRRGVTLEAFLSGGGQESGRRSGTENVPAIAGFGLAAELNRQGRAERAAKILRCRDQLQKGLAAEVPDIQINGPLAEDPAGAQSSPAILNVSFLGVKGEVLLHDLEERGIYVSTGSACSSRKSGSHVLQAMGLSQKEMEGAIRFSLNEWNEPEEMACTVAMVKESVARFRKLGRFR